MANNVVGMMIAMVMEMEMVMVMETYRGYGDGEVRSSHEGCKFVPPLHQNVTYYGVIK